jgi:hypothetical protein
MTKLTNVRASKGLAKRILCMISFRTTYNI